MRECNLFTKGECQGAAVNRIKDHLNRSSNQGLYWILHVSLAHYKAKISETGEVDSQYQTKISEWPRYREIGQDCNQSSKKNGAFASDTSTQKKRGKYQAV